MIKIVIDMTGQKIGKLTVLYRSKNNKYGQAMWRCSCECGNEKDVLGSTLRRKEVLSCGCLKRATNQFEIINETDMKGIDKQGNTFLFSKQDFEKISKYYWRVKPSNYVTTTVWHKSDEPYHEIELHRYIMCPTDNEEVDHINHNESDNRRENLRIVSVAQNQMNSGLSVKNTSGVKGVNWDKESNKWYARISVNGKRFSLGMYDDFNEAVKARKEAEEKYYGEYQYNPNITTNT